MARVALRFFAATPPPPESKAVFRRSTEGRRSLTFRQRPSSPSVLSSPDPTLALSPSSSTTSVSSPSGRPSSPTQTSAASLVGGLEPLEESTSPTSSPLKEMLRTGREEAADGYSRAEKFASSATFRSGSMTLVKRRPVAEEEKELKENDGDAPPTAEAGKGSDNELSAAPPERVSFEIARTKRGHVRRISNESRPSQSFSADRSQYGQMVKKIGE